MTMDVDVVDVYKRAMDWFDRNVQATGDDQWHLPTPCTQWDVRALVNHLVSENRWVPPLFAGNTIEEVGDQFEGDLLGDDPKAAWNESRDEALAAVGGPGAMDRITHLSFGDTPGREYAFQLFSDLLIHGWDLARGIGADQQMDTELVHVCYENSKASIEAWKSSGAFGPHITPPPGADEQTVLLALYGRVA